MASSTRLVGREARKWLSRSSRGVRRAHVPKKPGLSIVGIPCCYHADPEGNYFQGLHGVTDKYVRSICHAAGLLPVQIPALGPSPSPETDTWLDLYLDSIDGLFLTGSPSNINPALYGSTNQGEPPFDSDRDNTSLPLINKAIAKDLPIFAICRGLQEINVALGGTLDITITHEWENRRPSIYHGYPTDLVPPLPDGSIDQDLKYGPAHSVKLSGELAKIFGEETTMVNTCHYQAIGKLADGLIVEAIAPDGVIEAVRIEALSHFGIAVQWHPEYRQWLPMEGDREASEDMTKYVNMSTKLFKAFGVACASYRETKPYR
ncbi:hypothetical protein AAMO2058_000598400 [Amorphochlora amoebiformis]